MSQPPTVLVADANVGIAQAISRSLADEFLSLPPVHSLKFLRGILAIVVVDVLLMELSFGGENALDTLPDLVRDFPLVAFVIYAALASAALPGITEQLGASGFVHKGASLDEIASAIREAHAGGQPRYLGIDDSRQTVQQRAARCRKGDWAPTREKIGWLIEAGWSQAETRDTLQITKKDMEFQMHQIRLAKQANAKAPRQ